MPTLSRTTLTFPTARIQSPTLTLPVEVSLIAQLGHGAGDHLFQRVAAHQKNHPEFVDELDEPSARLAAPAFAQGDPTALYSFIVGPKGHPFHRHAGHRIFTAISGSGGAQLRFSSATTAAIAQNPQSFIDALQYINIPPDCLFTVRFGGETWHQFAPLRANGLHPVFIALSCHTNELGGDLPAATRQQVLDNQASIPALTELLPAQVEKLLQPPPSKPVPVIDLSFEAPPGSLQRRLCNAARCAAGLLRGNGARLLPGGGFWSTNEPERQVTELAAPPAGALLLQQLRQEGHEHEDMFLLSLRQEEVNTRQASELMGKVLEGFLQNPPKGVSWLMGLRNTLVRPMGLRTAALGCPVSSLLGTGAPKLFLNRYPVLAHETNAGNTRCQVVLGADDKHLMFRSCVGVEISPEGWVHATLGTRVHCKNAFGHLYMASINRIHRSYIAPTMLRFALDHALPQPSPSLLGYTPGTVCKAGLQ